MLVGLIACGLFEENGIAFELCNNTDMPVINVPFTISEKLEAVGIDRIEPNECTPGFLTKKNNIADGVYVFEFIRSNGKEEKKSAGYSANGSSL